MIFGRKKSDAESAVEEELAVSPSVEDAEESEEALDAGADSDADPASEADEAEAWDAAFAREEGPFDITEVDLDVDADEVKRIDLGTLIITPFPGMTMQLSLRREDNVLQSILVGDGESGLEVALFAGPSKSSMAAEIRAEIFEGTRKQGGQVKAVQGPFGAELRRAVPMADPEGRQALHISRTWLVSGPGWLLRGVLLGKATFEPNNEEANLALFEFFSNLVVRRGTKAAAPGTALPMKMPEQE